MGASISRAGWLVLFIATASWADPVGRGVSFLLQNQGSDGSFGVVRGEEPDIATHEALEALRTAGLRTSRESQKAEVYFASFQAREDSELVLRRQLSLAATGFNSYIIPLTSHASGFEIPDALHLALALRTLHAYGQTPAQQPWRLAWQLAQAARADGCHAFADNAASISLTAEAVLALRHYSYDALANGALGAAINCLKSAQRADGSFGSVEDSAMAVLALLEAPGDHRVAISSGRSFLAAQQLLNGSWEDGVRTTALAVRALGNQKPDWRIVADEWGRGTLVLSNPEPLLGQAVTARLDVENRSGSPSPVVPVRFVATREQGGAAIVLAEVMLSALEPGRVVSVTAQLPTEQLPGKYRVRAVVDPDGVHEELDELNNFATAPLSVRVENDLSLSNSDIRFTQSGANQVLVEVRVHNLGGPLTRDVLVDVYKGGVGSAGVKVGTATLAAGLGVNDTGSVTLTWNTQGVNGPTSMHAVVDSGNALEEVDEGNNHAFRFYYPGNSLPVDLSVVAQDVTRSVDIPAYRQRFTVRAVVRNLGTNDANRVTIGLLDNNAGVTPYGFVELPLVPAGGSAVAEFSLALEGSATLKVVADPDARLADSNRNNNSVIHGVSPSSRWDYDFSLGSLSTPRTRRT